MKFDNNTNYCVARKCNMVFIEKGYELNFAKIRLRKNEPFTVNGKKLMLSEDIEINKNEQGFFVLNVLEQCDIADMSIFPASYFVCESMEDKYSLLKMNLLLGGTKDLCLS